jgi:predicted transcriptional regulator
MPRTTTTVTISLDPAMAEEVEKVRKAEHRTSSELWRAAMRAFLRTRSLPTDTPTRAEVRTMEKGRAAIRRGDYYTLDEFRAFLLADTGTKARPQKRGTRAAPRARTSHVRT